MRTIAWSSLALQRSRQRLAGGGRRAVIAGRGAAPPPPPFFFGFLVFVLRQQPVAERARRAALLAKPPERERSAHVAADDEWLVRAQPNVHRMRLDAPRLCRRRRRNPPPLPRPPPPAAAAASTSALDDLSTFPGRKRRDLTPPVSISRPGRPQTRADALGAHVAAPSPRTAKAHFAVFRTEELLRLIARFCLRALQAPFDNHACGRHAHAAEHAVDDDQAGRRLL